MATNTDEKKVDDEKQPEQKKGGLRKKNADKKKPGYIDFARIFTDYSYLLALPVKFQTEEVTTLENFLIY